MKRFGIFICLFVLIIMLTGCAEKKPETTEVLSSTMETIITENTAPVLTEDPNDVRTLFDSVEGCVTILRIRVNPELELYLDVNGIVLDVKAVNDDAKTVLEGIDFSSASYDVGVQMILFALHDHGYSGDDRNIEITMYYKEEEIETEMILQTIGAAIVQVEQELNTTFVYDINVVPVMTALQENPGDEIYEERVEETETTIEESATEETTEEIREEEEVFVGPRYIVKHSQTGEAYEEWMKNPSSVLSGYPLSEFLYGGRLIVGCAWSTGGTGWYKEEIVDFVCQFLVEDNCWREGDSGQKQAMIQPEAVTFVGDWYWAPDAMTGVTSVDIGPYNGGEILSIVVNVDKVLGRCDTDVTGDIYTIEVVIIPE